MFHSYLNDTRTTQELLSYGSGTFAERNGPLQKKPSAIDVCVLLCADSDAEGIRGILLNFPI